MKLKPGLMGEASMTVQVGNTAAEVGSGSVPVFLHQCWWQLWKMQLLML